MKFNENLVSKSAVIEAIEQGESLIDGVRFSLDRIDYHLASNAEKEVDLSVFIPVVTWKINQFIYREKRLG